MNNNLFDNRVKEQFSNYSPDVPPHIWDAIVAKRKDRRPGLLFSLLNRKNLLILLCILLAGGSGAWLLNDTFSSSAEVKTTTTATTKDKNSGNDSYTESSSTTITIPDVTSTIATTTPANEAVTVADKNYSSSATTNQTTTANRSSIKKTSLTGSSRSDIETCPAATDAAVKNKRTVYSRKSNAVIRTTPATQTEDINEEEEDNDNELTTLNKLPAGGTLLGRLTYGIPEKGVKPNDKTLLNKRNAPDVVLPKCPVEKNISGNKKYVEVYSSYDYGLRSLKDSGNSAYLQKRKESTTFSSAYSAGIRYTKVFNNSMSVRGGINFSQINEKFSLVQGNVIQIIYIINSSGDTTGSYTTTGTRYKTTHNKYRTIDIPLLIGYEMGNGRLHTNINAGPVINIYSWQRGEVLDRNGQPVSITTGKSSTPYGFKTNAGIGFMGALSIYYKLTENLHLLAEPYFRYNFNQMNKENITFKQKYNTIGLRLGLRLDIP